MCREHSDHLTPVQVLIDKALVHITQKSYVQGLNMLSEAIDMDPVNPRANQLMAECNDKGNSLLPSGCLFGLLLVVLYAAVSASW